MGGEHFVLAWVDHAILVLSDETLRHGFQVNRVKQIGLPIDHVTAMFRCDRVGVSANSFGEI